jgi:hypothetical protein
MIEFNNQPKQVKLSQSRLDPNKNKKLLLNEVAKNVKKTRKQPKQKVNKSNLTIN